MNNDQNSLVVAERRINKAVSAETELSPNGAMAFRNVEQIMEFAKVMALAGVAVPKHLRESPGACLAVAIQACEWKMSPFAVANKSYVVNDRLGFEAQLVNAVILMRAPITGRFKITYSGNGPTRRCTVAAKLNDGSGETVEYESPEFQTIPTKNSPLWKGDPDQQLFYYSSRAMCRRHFPDVILGVYTADELQDSPREMREATGREVEEARVPKMFSGVDRESETQPDKAGGNAGAAIENPPRKPRRVPKETAPVQEQAAAPTEAGPSAESGEPEFEPKEKFWEAVADCEMSIAGVMQILVENGVTKASEAAGLTNEEATTLLDPKWFERLRKAYSMKEGA